MSRDEAAPRSALHLLDRAARGETLPAPAPMPLPDLRLRLPMRDGVRLDTSVWLPDAGRHRVPAILLRTPYKERTLGFRRLGVLRYVESGYAVVIQQIRGIGESEGRFEFSSPLERTDGHDTVEWMAQQPWCSGKVGMDGSSYAAMMQLAAAVTRPPHLRCIVPTVPTLDYFRELPYCGGIFSRQHTLNWSQLLQIDDLSELRGGFIGTSAMLADRAVLERLLSRPLADAADGLLHGDLLQHYRDVLAHPTFDAWWQARTIDAAALSRIEVPVLVVNGNFDLGIGALLLWRGLRAGVPAGEHHLLIGPWDHGQCYTGGAQRHGPYDLGEGAVLDIAAVRLAFFDRHLKEQGGGLPWSDPVRLFVTGSNRWLGLDAFPPRAGQTLTLHLDSGGHANSAQGDGRLVRDPPRAGSLPDHFVDDPSRPFVAALAAAREPEGQFDLGERAQHQGTLVYGTGPLAQDLTIVGEAVAQLCIAADAEDADVVCWLAERRADGSTVKLAFGQLRLRYREGFDRELPLEPGVPVHVRVPLTYVAHTLPSGSGLQLLVSGSNFPWADPNPHGAGYVAGATGVRVAAQTLFHDPARPSRLQLPIMVQNIPADRDLAAQTTDSARFTNC